MMTALFSRVATPLLATAALLAAAALLFWLTMQTIDGLVEDARSSAISERDAHWSTEIAKSEAEVQTRIAEELKETMAAQDAARAQVASVEAQLAQLESDNAALPDTGACGLGRDRVRLLNQR